MASVNHPNMPIPQLSEYQCVFLDLNSLTSEQNLWHFGTVSFIFNHRVTTQLRVVLAGLVELNIYK